MIFGEFRKVSIFIEKEKNERNGKKILHGPAHNKAGPTARIQPMLKKEGHQERLTRIWTFCIRNPDLFQKLLRPSHIFLSL
jgi:hypothetical protein